MFPDNVNQGKSTFYLSLSKINPAQDVFSLLMTQVPLKIQHNLKTTLIQCVKTFIDQSAIEACQKRTIYKGKNIL